MTLTLNGNTNTISGLAVGGLPNGIVDTDMLAAAAVTAAKSSGSAKGITEFDMWRVTSDFTQQNDFITSNWERADTDFAKIGTGLTESSGVFTFPSTGLWMVGFSIYAWDSDEIDYLGIQLHLADDGGSNYVASQRRTEALTSSSSDTVAANAYSVICLDITNTSNNVIKFRTVASTSVSWNARSEEQRTGFWTMKVGDT